ncbi:MAG TPA: hypothetical protein VGJ20_23940 [Xanthobacteraceae bacterium]|jgi:hypothetical protein
MAAIPEMLTRLLFSSWRTAALLTAVVRKIEFTSLMLNPQSKARAARGLNSFVSDFRAASWMAAAFEIFERCAESVRDVDVPRQFPIKP